MSLRHPKGRDSSDTRAWGEWLSRNALALKAIGLPPELTASRSHWIDFLQNGYLERNPESHAGFVWDRLSPNQMGQLLAVLDALPEYAAEPMSRWLRRRLNEGGLLIHRSCGAIGRVRKNQKAP